jgi:hypothetical protein
VAAIREAEGIFWSAQQALKELRERVAEFCGIRRSKRAKSQAMSMVCTECGLIGADARPDWSPHTNARHPVTQVERKC